MATDESSAEEAAKAAYREKLQSLRFGRVPGGNRQEKGLREGPNPAWERGIKGEHRPDGSFMPYIDANTMSPIRMKTWSEHKHGYEAELKQLRTATPEE